MPEKYTRREFSKIAGATATFQLGGDDDEDGILSRIFGDEEESSSNTEGAVYVDVENELESVNPGPNEVFITTDTERIFKPTDDGKWTEFASLGGDSPWVENADGALTPENGEPVNVGELNSTVWVDPDATDFGTALEDAVSRVSTGGEIRVPAVTYPECSGALVDKRVSILGAASGHRKGTNFGPIVTKTTDAPCIETAEGVGIHLEGVAFDAEGFGDTTVAVKVRGSSNIRSCVANYMGSHAFLLAQETTNDNLNLSHVTNVSATWCSGDVVRAENTSGGANNINSIKVYVNDHFQNSGWAINTGANDCNGSEYVVNTIQGNQTSGGIRFNSQRCYGVVYRHEGAGPIGQFDQPTNTFEYWYDNTGNGVTWNNNNNTRIQRDNNTRENRYRQHRFTGTDIEQTDAGMGLIVTTPDGTARYRIRVDNNGAVTTDAI